MKNIKILYPCFLIIVCIYFLLSCSKDNPTESQEAICFTVDGHDVTVHNLWKDGTSYTKNVGGLLSFNETTNRNNETHTLEWTNIQSDFEKVYSFDVNIDGKSFRYPENACGEVPNVIFNQVSFRLNGNLFTFGESCGLRNYPHGYYVEAYQNTPEQYNIFASNSTDDCQLQKNTIIITFYNINGWKITLQYFDETGNVLQFLSYNVDISNLINRDIIGEQMSFNMAGPLSSVDNTYSISELSISVERVESPSLPPQSQYLTHNTGNLQVSVFQNGNIGHYQNSDVGSGITFNGSPDAIYSSGLIIGTLNRGFVNGHLGSFSIHDDFVNVSPITGFSSIPPNWNEVAITTYDDYGAPVPLGLEIDQISYANTNENSIIINYRFYGNSLNFTDLYAGIFADWDVGETTFDTNLGGYDPIRNMAYQFDSTGSTDQNYYGIVALSGMAGARVTELGTNNSIRDSSFIWISNFVNEPITTAGDYRMWIGSGPFTLQIGDTLDVYFSIVAGNNLSDLIINADAAIQKFNDSF